ncbi:MAG: class I SAM-dependent methyltransferase [Rhodobacteraceae bacterium]|nr:class I SAM-dependent methyltransferase [Paracoccaceae bacterium]
MHLDVVDLHSFYYRTKLGRIAQRALREKIVAMWPDTKGQTVAGFGFAGPMLRPFLVNSRRVMNLMPGPQGVMPWPDGMANHSVLVEETQWSIATGSLDRLIVLHGLDTCENPTALLDEIWRVLGPGGRALFVVPNRSGIWARRDVTPFGYGSPYSLNQLETQLQIHRFLPLQHASVLFTPPSHRPFFIRSAPLWERIGHHMPMAIAAGVVMVEVTKQVHAPKHTGIGEAVRRPLNVLEGIAKPAGKPVSGRTQDIV